MDSKYAPHKMISAELPTSSQFSPRPYTRFVLCFPFDTGLGSKKEAIDALQESLDLAVSYWPFLAGQVIANQGGGSGRGRISIRYQVDAGNRASKVTVPLHVQCREGYSVLHYDKLRGKGFPADAFRCDLLSPTDSFPSGTSPAAVLSVTANFVRNGLILTIFLHHTVGDGYSMGKLIDLLAKCTHAKTKSMELPSAELWVQRLEKTLGLNKFDPYQLAQSCPEHVIASDINPQGPSQPLRLPRSNFNEDKENPVVGVIFTIPGGQLEKAKDRLNEFIGPDHGQKTFVSSNAVIGAVFWSHLARVRFPESLQTDSELHGSLSSSPTTPSLSSNTPSESPKSLNRYMIPATDGVMCKITMPVNNRPRMDPPLPEGYIGCSVSIAIGSLRLVTLKAACVDTAALAEAVWAIRQAAERVDDAFIRRRLELAKAVPDVRALDLSYDLEDSTDVRFNTWAGVGMNVSWKIPGVPSEEGGYSAFPDAIRRGHDGYANNGAIVLPRRKDSDTWELFVQLRRRDMDMLCNDSSWRKFVDRVIE